MKNRKKKTKPEPPQHSEAACKVAWTAHDFTEAPGYALEEIASAADHEFSRLVEATELAAEYLETVKDPEARFIVESIRSALDYTTTKNRAADGEDDEEKEEAQYKTCPDPTGEEIETAIEFMVCRLNQDFLSDVRERLIRNEDPWTEMALTPAFGNVKWLLRRVGFKWRGEFFQEQLPKLVNEAARRASEIKTGS